jgi:DNA-binding NarL/FixJ family response regulator
MPKQILIADDNETVRKVLRAIVETHDGWQVCGEASNGKEAIARACERKPDLIIMDFAMPLLDGISASREISRSVPGIPILLHTQHDYLQLAEEARKAGIETVVSKMESVEKLLRAMETLLAGKGNAPSKPEELIPTQIMGALSSGLPQLALNPGSPAGGVAIEAVANGATDAHKRPAADEPAN